MSIKLWQKIFLVWWRVWVLQFSITSTFPWCAVTRRTSTVNPVETGRKLNVHKTIRRYPGHLLKVLCTFNLRPVSTGKREPQRIFVNAIYVVKLSNCEWMKAFVILLYFSMFLRRTTHVSVDNIWLSCSNRYPTLCSNFNLYYRKFYFFDINFFTLYCWIIIDITEN